MKTWQLLVVGILLHSVFFYSIFDIYFTSPIVHGMTLHLSPVQPPAKRLVLFSADGLRADKMFEFDHEGKNNIPYLRSIIENRGGWGVSHTRVPTESRPGHVALIAGFYEDVSAVAKGWKENPVEFDSVFNQSRYTWSWGSPDILPMFAKGATGGHVFTKCYPAHFEDFGSNDHSRLDHWVFDEVKMFFKSSESNSDLHDKLHKDKVIFFLHLLGLDTSGHSKKPYSKEYIENIRIVDKGIEDTVQLIENFYGNDGKTAYVMSSDHGMTDWGSHGAGHPSETLTPLVVWGSGVRGPIHENSAHKYQDSFSQDWKLDHLRRTDVEQADVAPLMSALVGVNFPVNSVGTLKYDFLNFGDYELAEVMFANARQILEQYQVKMEMKKSTTVGFAFRPFSELTAVKLADKHRHIRNLIQNGHYQDAIKESEDVIEIGLRGLNYYQTYDRLFLGTSIFFGFTGWMAYILTLIFEKHSGIVKPKVRLEKQCLPFWRTDEGIKAIFAVIGSIIVILLYVQSLPWTNYIYCLIPVVLWMVVTLRFDIFVQVYRYTLIMKNRNSFIVAVAACLIGLEILVIGFFYREMLSVGLAFIGLLPWLSVQKSTAKKSLLSWSLSCILLAIFPMLPVVTGRRNTIYVILGCGCILIGSVFGWKKFSHIEQKETHMYRLDKSQSVNKTLFLVQIAVVLTATYFSGFLVTSGLSMWQHKFSWLTLGISIIEPLLGSTNLYCRLLTIFLAFVSPFILLSVSYEILFIASLCTLLYQWLCVECTMQASSTVSLADFDFNSPRNPAVEKSRYYLVIGDIQRAFYFIFLILTAFFGTGNIASVNSFDPSAVLCFVSVFSPFIMGALLLFKIMIPFILVTCTLQAIHTISRVPIQGLFLLILLMSDSMALHFFFLVRDYGSWLDIGTSISHYVIVMCMIIFILLLFGVSHILTRCNIRSSKTST